MQTGNLSLFRTADGKPIIDLTDNGPCNDPGGCSQRFIAVFRGHRKRGYAIGSGATREEALQDVCEQAQCNLADCEILED